MSRDHKTTAPAPASSDEMRPSTMPTIYLDKSAGEMLAKVIVRVERIDAETETVGALATSNAAQLRKLRGEVGELHASMLRVEEMVVRMSRLMMNGAAPDSAPSPTATTLHAFPPQDGEEGEG